MQREPSRRSLVSFKWSRVFEEKLVEVDRERNGRLSEQSTTQLPKDEVSYSSSELSRSHNRESRPVRSAVHGRLGIFVQDYMR